MPWVRHIARPATSLLAAGLATALLMGALGTGAATAADVPAAPADAPRHTEGFSPYLPQVSCDPAVKPGIDAMRTMLLAAFGGRDLGITRGCDVGGTSEHKEGRAWDWGFRADVPADMQAAGRFFDWLFAAGPNGMPAQNARRLGVMYVIWNGRIWSSYRADEGWRPYGGGESHADHIHISLSWAGAEKRTSWWTGKAADVDYGPCVEVEGMPAPAWTAPNPAPCPPPASASSLTGTPLLRRGDTSPYVIQLQRLLSVTPVTGFFGPLTEAALVAFQQAHGLPATATTTDATWAAVRRVDGSVTTPAAQTVTAARSLPSVMRYRVRKGDSLSRVAKVWRSSVAGIKDATGLRDDLIRVGQIVKVPVRSGITKFTWTFLDRGDRGVAVKALQTALRMKRKYRTGYFGAITERRVRHLQESRGWRVDGVARAGVWRALGA